MLLLLVCALLVAAACAVYRSARCWGIAAFWFFAAAVSFLGASGVLSGILWGPQWSWNFAHHDRAYAVVALVQGVCFLALGVGSRASRRSHM